MNNCVLVALSLCCLSPGLAAAAQEANPAEVARGLVAPVSLDGQQTGEPARTTRVEELAPGVFDGSRQPVLAEGEVRYRVDATVLIPLLITAIPLVSRENVGVGSFTVRDFDTGDGARLRAYEFFAASIPDRARGLNRLGFIREVAKLDADATRWTAQFGVISADRAQTREAAEQSLDQNQNLQPYKIIDAIIEPRQNRSNVTALVLEGLWESAAALYADVRPAWATAPAEASLETDNPGGALYGEPVGFLGAIQSSLRRVGAALADGADPSPFSYPYIHNGRVFQLEFRGHDIDRGRHDDYSSAGLVTPEAVVHRLDYRVVNDEGDEAESFELWTELPSESALDPLSAAIFPLAFEFKPRSYLKLGAVQIPPVSGPSPRARVP